MGRLCLAFYRSQGLSMSDNDGEDRMKKLSDKIPVNVSKRI